MIEEIKEIPSEEERLELKARRRKRKEKQDDSQIYYLSATWRIEKDRLNYILRRRSTHKEGQEDRIDAWLVHGYYQTINQLYHALVELKIRETVLKDIKTLNDTAKELHDMIDKEIHR